MRALLSVYDKTGIVDFATALHELHVELVSSGGTAKAIAAAGIPVTDVAEYTGSPAMLGHRVVTLHPKVHGGILADRDDPEHQADLVTYEIPTIDLVVVNLYPFSTEPSIELIDIGGPTMVRAAAKNFAHVGILVDPADYKVVLDELGNTGMLTDVTRRRLARKAFAHTAAYDAQIVQWFDEVDAAEREVQGLPPKLPDSLHIAAELTRTLGKGENGHQAPAAMYSVKSKDPFRPDAFQLLEGNPGWVNWTDLHRSLITLTTMAAALEVNTGTDPSMLYALAVKHGNASGASYGRDPIEVLQRTLYGNLISVHGGWLIVNFPIGRAEAECLRLHAIKDPAFKRILAGVVAPDISSEAREILHRKDDLCAMLVNPALAEINWESRDRSPHIRQIESGFMVQPRATFVPEFASGKGLEVSMPLSMNDIPHLALAWAVGSTTISNTIALVGSQRLLGLGCGQQDRVGAAKLALDRFEEANQALRELDLPLASLSDAVGYSDSFFPFPDGLLVLIEAGIPTIFASSGSLYYESVRQTAADHKANLVTLPDAICRGFFGH